MISKIVGLFFVIFLFQAHQVYGDEELPIITVDFVSGDVIDLDKSPQMIRADIQIQNYNPQHGYHYMQITRVNDGEIVKDTEILPKQIGGEIFDNLYGVQILHYIEPGQNEETLIGDYTLRIYSEFGPSENLSTFSIIKSSMPEFYTQSIDDELETSNSTSVELEESIELETSNSNSAVVEDNEESKIPSWIHDIFVMYAENDISEDELLAALEYLINLGTINVNSN